MKTNKMITGIIAGMSIFAFAAVSRAQVLPPVAPGVDGPIDPAGGALKRANGEVTSVDAKSGKLMIKTATDELNLDVQGASAKGSLANIKVGDKVSIAYQDKGGTLVANSVSKATASSSSDDIGSPSTKKSSQKNID
jgi:Cu/Ag efflux protein CusF